MEELVQAMLMAQTPFSVVSSSSGRAYSQKHIVISSNPSSVTSAMHLKHRSDP